MYVLKNAARKMNYGQSEKVHVPAGMDITEMIKENVFPGDNSSI